MVEGSSLPANADVESLQRAVMALDRLMQVNLVLSSTLALEPLLQFIMDAATEITDSEAASILLLDRHTHELRFAASTGSASESLKSVIVPLEGSVAGTIVTENRAIVIDNVAHDSRHFRQADEKTAFVTRSILGVPMRIKERVIGVLEAVNKRAGRFVEDDERYLTILASQAAVAIENARLVAELRRTYDELNTLDKLKTDFIAIASHELRTPLSVILGYASFLKDEAEGEASQHAERLLASALHLRGLIEDLTNLRFVQMDSAPFDLVTISIDQVLRAAHADVVELADAKSQSLSMDVPAEPIYICVDAAKLETAITNVLHNAIKFTPEGGVIRIGARAQSGEVWIVVQDNGIGIPPGELKRIFEQFYQVEDHMVRRHGGMGLGLTTAKAIIERHGGRIWAESDGPGRGSTFVMTVPLASPES